MRMSISEWLDIVDRNKKNPHCTVLCNGITCDVCPLSNCFPLIKKLFMFKKDQLTSKDSIELLYDYYKEQQNIETNVVFLKSIK